MSTATYSSWYALVLEVLEAGEELCLGLIRSAAPSDAEGGVVELIEGPTTSIDALSYARVLLELGRRPEAEEVLRAVIGAEVGHAVPQGAQGRTMRPQGAQILA